MARKKRPKLPEEHASEAWLIPYADILTLLLALFIVLFAVSQTDQKKVSEMAQAFSAAFNTGGPSMFDKAGPNVSQNATLPVESANQSYLQENQQLQEVQQKMEDYIKGNNLQEELSTVLTEEGLLIRIKEKALFASGSAELLPQSQEISKPIAMLLASVSQKVVVSGHTDNVPISNSEFASNWDLSTRRALNFMKFMLQSNDLDPARFNTAGYGEFHPAATNDTEAGRAQNRRVEILISRSQHNSQMQNIR